MLTPVFGTAINLYKMISNEEVFYMKKLGIVDVNIFVVRAIAIRFHLESRNYVWSSNILAFEALFCQLGLQDIIKWKNLLHGVAWYRRSGRFWYLKRPNLSSYEEVMAKSVRRWSSQSGSTVTTAVVPWKRYYRAYYRANYRNSSVTGGSRSGTWYGTTVRAVVPLQNR